jgi:ABC-type uncharacterized transport system ATPase subunit
MTRQHNFAVRLEAISKRFGEVLANDGIDFAVRPGSIHALLGENGAGKSTLVSILSGRYRPDKGRILLNGKQVQFHRPADALSAGIGIVHQRFMLVEPLTVLENLLLADRNSDRRQMARNIEKFREAHGLSIDLKKRIRELSMGERQRVEIAKLLVQNAKVLIFDEPTAILTPNEIDGFFDILRSLKKKGRSVVFITHKLDEVLAVADEISILRKGRLRAVFRPDEIQTKREIARLMVGREVVLEIEKENVETSDIVFAASNVGKIDSQGRPRFQNISFELKRGEVFAVVGVAGNGQSELASALAGRTILQTGTLFLEGFQWRARHWSNHVPEIRKKIAFVPEDRHGVGSVPGMNLFENYSLTTLSDINPGIFIDRKKMIEKTLQALKEYGISAGSPHLCAGQLSGGNLQRLILARELSRKPSLFIAEQPTQGLDIRSTEEIWKAILKQRRHSAIILITGDLKEALALADRIAVIFRGRFLEVFPTSDTDAVVRIGLLMAGVEKQT